MKERFFNTPLVIKDPLSIVRNQAKEKHTPNFSTDYLDDKEIVRNKIQAEVSLPEFILEFDGRGCYEVETLTLIENPEPLKYTMDFDNKIFAMFFTNETHFHSNIDPYDYDFVCLNKFHPRDAICFFPLLSFISNLGCK